MKRSKFIQIFINSGICLVGFIVIGNILISYQDVNPLTAYEFWAFGICPIIFGGIFLQRILEKSKRRKKK